MEVDLPGGLGGNLELGFSIKLQEDASFVPLHTTCTSAFVTLEELALPFFICLIFSTCQQKKLSILGSSIVYITT